MNILGLGTDIIEIERIEHAIARYKDRFLERLFTEKEQAYCQKFGYPAPHFAARFAAKEAILKALGTGLKKEWNWRDIEILNNPEGKPEVFFSPPLKQVFPGAILLTMSHCRAYATATALYTETSKKF